MREESPSYRQGVFRLWDVRDLWKTYAGENPEEGESMRTVKVRAAVAVDPETGMWSVFGQDDWDDEEMKAEVFEDGDQLFFITAEIPIRDVPEIEAEVEP